MKKIFILFFIIQTIISCKINGNLKGLLSNYNNSNSEKPEIFYHSKQNEDISNIKLVSPAKIIIINGKQIKKQIENYQKTLIYIWRPNCRGILCIPPELIQKNCDLKKIELFIVSEYYDNKQMEINYNLKNPIYGIDVDYYNSNITTNYIAKFKFDLSIYAKTNNRYLYFEKGNYIKSYENFNDIE